MTRATFFGANRGSNRKSYLPSVISRNKKRRLERQKKIAEEVRQEKLVNQFEVFDHENSGIILASHLYDKVKDNTNLKDLAEVEDLVNVLNDAVGAKISGDQIGLTFLSFEHLLRANLTQYDEEISLQELRRAVFEVETRHLVASTLHIESDNLAANRVTNCRFQTILESVVGATICINTVTIGINIDTESKLLDALEYVFTGIFTVELFLKLIDIGPADLYLGPEWKWNWFDAIIVALAWSGIILHASGSKNNTLGNLTVLRLFRLLRLTRLVRLIKMFKELSLMVQGLLGGLSTLFWAIVLYTGFVYTLAVLLTQVISLDDIEVLSTEECESLFGSVPRSMWTVFRCFSDGCQTNEGDPLPPILQKELGVLFPLLYVIVYVVIFFGLFNLIMAVFVENTLRTAKFNERTVDSLRQSEDARLGRKLTKLIRRFCEESTSDEVPKRSKATHLIKLLPTLSKTLKADEKANIRDVGVHVTQDTWMRVVSDPEVQRLMDDLNIQDVDREGLFELLDADGDGELDMMEIIQGILKVRGDARRSDVIAVQLTLRAVQSHLRTFEEEVLRNQKTTKQVLEKLAETHKTLEKSLTSQERELASLVKGSVVDKGCEVGEASSTNSGEAMSCVPRSTRKIRNRVTFSEAERPDTVSEPENRSVSVSTL